MSECLTPKRVGAEAGDGCNGHEGYGASPARKSSVFLRPSAGARAVVELGQAFQKAVQV